jgi:hypothetical protein
MSEPPEGTPPSGGGPSAPGDAERAPGWYPDPDGSGWSRYWDGHAWAPVTPEQLAEREGAPARRSRFGRTIDRVLISGAVIVAAVVLVVATRSSGGGSSATHTTATQTVGARTTATRSVPPSRAHGTTGATGATGASTTPLTAAAITGVVNGYVSAVNHRNLPALTALLSPQLVRHAGNGPPQNLARALTLYRAQFAAEANPGLKLGGLHVAPGAGQGSAGARFGINQHGGRTRGTIAFHMAQSGPRLLIDQLIVRNH